MWYLCKNRGTTVKTEDLFMEVWKEKYYEKDNNTIMVHIWHLREKMNDIGRELKYIKTIWGVGYKIENPINHIINNVVKLYPIFLNIS